MEPARPEFVPDPALSREGMEALQREIAAAATFEDAFGFDPSAIGLASSIGPVSGGGGGQTRLGDVRTERAGGDGTALVGGGGDDVEPAAESREAAEPVVVGVDQAFLDDRAVSGIVALRGGEVVERVHAVRPLTIPYIPGLLSFREGGPILAAFEALAVEPDLALFDGSGRIHFRQAGIATHLGVVLDLPSVGVAKSLLCGRPREPVDALPRGARVPIEADERVEDVGGEVIGYAVQTRQFPSSKRVNPLYVSSGHRVGAETAADLVLGLSGDYKLPEPVRLADRYVGEVRDELDAAG